MTAPAEDDDMLAAELAFGLLDPDEESEVRARVARDPAFAVRLARWEQLAATLLAGDEEPPRPSLWREIDRRLPGNDDAKGEAALAARWRAASLALGVIAAVLGALALRPAVAPPPTPAPQQIAAAPLIAVLRAKGEGATVAIGFDPESNRLTLAADALDVQAGSAELWAIPAGGSPHSLGLIAADAPGWRTSPQAAGLIAPGVTLAVTLEPQGGSPTGRPSGTPLLTGTVAAAQAEGAPGA